MVQKTVPLWLAPNVITFAGLIFPVASLFIFMYYCPGLVGEFTGATDDANSNEGINVNL
jgi:hypothetical protein